MLKVRKFRKRTAYRVSESYVLQLNIFEWAHIFINQKFKKHAIFFRLYIFNFVTKLFNTFIPFNKVNQIPSLLKFQEN